VERDRRVEIEAFGEAGYQIGVARRRRAGVAERGVGVEIDGLERSQERFDGVSV
jgi:hypothetical protein